MTPQHLHPPCNPPIILARHSPNPQNLNTQESQPPIILAPHNINPHEPYHYYDYDYDDHCQ